jgi:hypothetical protein
MDDNRIDERLTSEEKGSPKKHDPLSGMTGGLILIVLGVLFFLAQQDYISWDKWWAYFLIGLGGIFILESFIRILRPGYGRDFAGKLIAGAILIAIGASGIFGVVSWWPLILIAVGIVIIISAFQKARQ